MDAGEVGGQHRVKLRDQAQMFSEGNIGHQQKHWAEW